MTEARSDAIDLELLRTLRLVGFATTDVLVVRLGHDERDLMDQLRRLESGDQVLCRRGRMAGWSITAAGRERLAVLADVEVAPVGVRLMIERCYRRFGPVNTSFLALCTAWQLRPDDPGGSTEAVVNDHSDADADYDREVIVRLRAIDVEIQELLGNAAEALERFDAYRRRLEHAVGRVECGELDWFTRPVIDSYHTVWFELHEDLLTTLGLERSNER